MMTDSALAAISVLLLIFYLDQYKLEHLLTSDYLVLFVLDLLSKYANFLATMRHLENHFH